MRLIAAGSVFFAACWLAAPACAQRISPGVRVGAPFNDAFQTIQTRTPFNLKARRYTFGPTIEIRILDGLTVEFDALYRSAEFSSATGSTWEFPLLAKHVRGRGPIRPFIGGGFAFNRFSGLKQFAGTLGIVDRTNTGAVTGGGLELHVSRIRISPEIRFTRWGNQSLLNRNQASFLVGITF
jgi:opacity protein-like surface antigen